MTTGGLFRVCHLDDTSNTSVETVEVGDEPADRPKSPARKGKFTLLQTECKRHKQASFSL